MVSLAKKRIKDVFDDSLKNVCNGKKPNVSGNMIKHGYSKSSARCLKVITTQAWQECLAKLDDSKILDEFYKIALGKKELRAKLEAGKEIFKLKDRYPAQKTKILGLFSVLDSLEEDGKE